jgi:hypothetical protein
MSATVTSLPHSKFAGGRHQICLLCRLVYLQFSWGSAPAPFLQNSRCPALCVLFSCLFIIQGFFVGQGSVCQGGYTALSQGWLWEYWVLLICSLVDLHLSSRLGVSGWQRRNPPGFSVYCGMGKLCVGWAFGCIRVLPLFGGFSWQVCFQFLSKIFSLRSTCYLLPTSSHHLGSSCLNSKDKV